MVLGGLVVPESTPVICFHGARPGSNLAPYEVYTRPPLRVSQPGARWEKTRPEEKSLLKCNNKKLHLLMHCGAVVPQQLISFCDLGVETRRGGLCGVTITMPRSRRSATKVTPECPRGARMALKDYSGIEAVRSRGYLQHTRTVRDCVKDLVLENFRPKKMLIYE